MSTAPIIAVRGEQLRLVLDGIAQSFPVGFLLSSLLVVVVDRVAPLGELLVWYGSFVAIRIVTVTYARHARGRSPSRARGRATEQCLMMLKIAEGCCWGALLWIGLGSSEPAVSILLLALMCAICGNSVSLLSPLRDLYLALVLPVLVFTFARLWLLDTLPYQALAICCILYVVGQYGQVRIANARIRETIALQFENTELVKQLRRETDVARGAVRDAEQANTAKSHFLAAASHDLRQPIHALGLYVEALGHTRLSKAQRKTVDSAKAACRASGDMLNTLLDFSRIEASVIVPQPRAIPLQAMLDRLENELAPMADARSLVYRSPKRAPRVVSDPVLLEMILRNLIHNAIRYTAHGGLLIGCRMRGGMVSIEIYDTGIGIAADQQEEIFREFHQLGNPERDRQKGLGLGLAISKGLAITLDHKLTVSSVPGQGSVFRLLLPLAGQQVDEADVPAGEAVREVDVAGLTIIVIDDDPIVCTSMEHLLRSWNCTPLLAASLEDAMDCLMGADRPDLIICDYRLRDGRNGAQVIQALRNYLDTDIPALLITGDTAPDRLREAAISCIPLMHKPVIPKRLKQHLGRIRNVALEPTEN